MNVHRCSCAWLGVAAAASLACQYSYDNPAERLSAGQVSGRTVYLDPTLVPAPGVAVSLRGSHFNQVSHPTGSFTLLPLPVGRHTLLFRDGGGAAMLRVVDVRLGRDGQPEGVRLGDVDLPSTASLAGEVTQDGHAGVVLDEVSGTLGSIGGGAYRLDHLGLGDHLLKFALLDLPGGREWLGGPVPVGLADADQRSVKRLSLTTVRLATGATGTLRFRVVSLQAGLPASAATVAVDEVLAGPVPASVVPDADGYVELTVPEGLYHLRVASPAADVPAPPPGIAVVLGGRVADAGSLYLVPDGVTLAAQNACTSADDCRGRAGGDCVAGACVGYSPPTVVPATVPFCDVVVEGCVGGAACVTSDGLDGWCFPVDANLGTVGCVPCASSCTLDTRATLTTPIRSPASGQCQP